MIMQSVTPVLPVRKTEQAEPEAIPHLTMAARLIPQVAAVEGSLQVYGQAEAAEQHRTVIRIIPEEPERMVRLPTAAAVQVLLELQASGKTALHQMQAGVPNLMEVPAETVRRPSMEQVSRRQILTVGPVEEAREIPLVVRVIQAI